MGRGRAAWGSAGVPMPAASWIRAPWSAWAEGAEAAEGAVHHCLTLARWNGSVMVGWWCARHRQLSMPSAVLLPCRL